MLESPSDNTETMADEESEVKYRQWAIALGVTTAVFLVTTLLLACILFVVVCRKIAKLRKEREARVTGVMQGVASPHWIDHTNLNDMLSQERDNPESKPQNIWSISTQTFEQNQVQQPSQSTSTVTNPVDIPSVPAQTPRTGGTAQNGILVSSGTSFGVENFSRVTDDGERMTSLGTGSPTAAAGGQRSIKPSRLAPPPPKSRKKSKGQNDTDYDQEPTPYVYPMQKLMQKLKQHRGKERDPGATAQTGGNQSHEYAQPHMHLQMQHDVIKQTPVSNSKDKYQPIDPKRKQPVGQYQDLVVNSLSRGQSLPTMSTFATLS